MYCLSIKCSISLDKDDLLGQGTNAPALPLIVKITKLIFRVFKQLNDLSSNFLTYSQDNKSN